VNVNDVIRDVLTLTRAELRNRHVSVKTELRADLPAVLGDTVQLQQVVLNLIVNGVEAMASVETGSRELEIKSQLDDTGDVLVLVRDSGVGLAPGIADQIFRPFFTTKEGGIGMGLAICRSIVEAHGGRLGATQGSPSGAVFQFALPPAGRCNP
jgi:C4-dicarboxylate-specific signal transduction histidine kinase